MAVTKAKKIEQVEKLSQDLQSASHAIVGTFSQADGGEGLRTPQGGAQRGRPVIAW